MWKEILISYFWVIFITKCLIKKIYILHKQCWKKPVLKKLRIFFTVSTNIKLENSYYPVFEILITFWRFFLQPVLYCISNKSILEVHFLDKHFKILNILQVQELLWWKWSFVGVCYCVYGNPPPRLCAFFLCVRFCVYGSEGVLIYVWVVSLSKSPWSEPHLSAPFAFTG